MQTFLMALLATGKICDIFTDNHGGHLCGPALLVPGVGKCGTNALSTYLQQHPSIVWSRTSEPDFDPASNAPEQIVRQENPGVTPEDGRLWAMKSPMQGWKDQHALALRLKQAFPSAKILLTLCDPELLLFRVFRHHLARTLRDSDTQARITIEEFAEHVRREYQINSLADLYRVIYPIDSGCNHTAADVRILHELRARYVLGMDLFNEWRCRAWRHVAEYDLVLSDYTRAGYVLGESISAVYLEDWDGDAASQSLRRVSHLLGLSLDLAPWRETSFAPVYTLSAVDDGLASVGAAPKSQRLALAVRRECCVLWRQVGERPPWSSCAFAEAVDSAACAQVEIDSPAPFTRDSDPMQWQGEGEEAVALVQTLQSAVLQTPLLASSPSSPSSSVAHSSALQPPSRASTTKMLTASPPTESAPALQSQESSNADGSEALLAPSAKGAFLPPPKYQWPVFLGSVLILSGCILLTLSAAISFARSGSHSVEQCASCAASLCNKLRLARTTNAERQYLTRAQRERDGAHDTSETALERHRAEHRRCADAMSPSSRSSEMMQSRYSAADDQSL